jgi:uncharacterized membrane protein
MAPKLRKLVLAIHITASVGWLGAVVAYLPFDVLAATSDDASLLRMSYGAMDIITTWVIVPLAIAAWSTGIIMGFGTKWGLFRHYWVVTSLVLTTLALIVLLVEARVVADLAAMAEGASETQLRSMPSTLVHSVGGLVVLLVVQVLNVYKPRGLTKYGWRKQQASG